ncbi:MAG TPA: hypothetical protein VGN46_03615 [Luteibacter sp.]|jgi:hypothetical protein|uniref:hypothetical protein n=1 Tax=Luteibacter sp. TaxID=1886636 RepID=UPI002F3E8324
MKTIASLAVIAALTAATPAFAARCPSPHAPGGTEVCDLYSGEKLKLVRGGQVSQRIALPLDTTIDDGDLPLYSAEAKTWNFGGTAANVRISMSLTDDTGGHAVELGSASVALQGGHDRISLAVKGARFAQPAYLNVTLESDAEGGPNEVDIDQLGVIQSYDPDVEHASR